jgi:hypothetical protein
MKTTTISKAWENRSKIWEGLRNKTFKQSDVEELYEERIAICRSNKCGNYDPTGESEKAVFKGKESCGACGCRLDWKARSLSSTCGLEDIQQEPLWKAVVSEQEDLMIKEVITNNTNQPS